MTLADRWDRDLISHREEIEARLWERLARITPLRRDLISDGYDEAVDALRGELPLTMREYPSGTKCDTWTIPQKWTCHAARLENLSGEVIFSDQDTPLRVPSYSTPFSGIVSRDELMAHLYTHPRLPDAIPFKFFYYQPRWGLCCTQLERDALMEESYRVHIETTVSGGQLKTIEAKTSSGERNFLLCAHLCHPAMANDDATGVAVAMEAFRFLADLPDLRINIHLLLMPETIGSAAWLSDPESPAGTIDAGLFLEMLGRAMPFSIQRTLDDNHELDVALWNASLGVDPDSWSGEFASVICNDERQFNGPGVGIPMASLSRVMPVGAAERPYPEYHTHLDTLERCQRSALFGSLRVVVRTIAALQESEVVVPRFRGELFLQSTVFGQELLADTPRRLRFLRFVTRLNGRDSIAKGAMAAGISLEEARQFSSMLAAEGFAEITKRIPLTGPSH